MHTLIKELPEKEDLISIMLDLDSRYEKSSITTCQHIQWLRPWSQLYSNISEKIIGMITKCQIEKIPCEKLIDAEAHYTATFNSQGLYITISRKPKTKIVTNSGQIITDEATKISFPLTLPSNFYAISRAAYQLADNIHDNTEKLKAIYKNESLFNGLLQPLQHIIGESQTELDITKAINTWNALIKTNTQKNQHKKREESKKHNKVVKKIPWLSSQTKSETQAIHELIKTALPLKNKSDKLKEFQSEVTSDETTNSTETETVFMILMDLYRCAQASQRLLEMKQAEELNASLLHSLELIHTSKPTDTKSLKLKTIETKPTTPTFFPSPSRQYKQRQAEINQELKLFSSLYAESKIRAVKNTMAYTLTTYKNQAQELAKAYEKDEKLLLQKIQEGQEAIYKCEAQLSKKESQLNCEQEKVQALTKQNQEICHKLREQQEKLQRNYNKKT